MDNMILGRYIPGNSIVHRLDPRSKLVAMILLIIIVFLGQQSNYKLNTFRCNRHICSSIRSSLIFFHKRFEVDVFSDYLYNPFSHIFK